jgi:hypothetical protein
MQRDGGWTHACAHLKQGLFSAATCSTAGRTGKLTGEPRSSSPCPSPSRDTADQLHLDTDLSARPRVRFTLETSLAEEQKLFSWFSTKNSVAFGSELAAIVIDLVPKDDTIPEAKRQSKINYAKEKMQRRIRQFKQEEVLNFFKTAKLLNTFQWALKDAGYSKELTSSLSSWVFVGLRNVNF